jgi:hypothetical protein
VCCSDVVECASGCVGLAEESLAPLEVIGLAPLEVMVRSPSEVMGLGCCGVSYGWSPVWM